MDFDLTPEKHAVQDLASELLGDRSGPEALRAIEGSDPERFDRTLWAAMADAGLLSLVAPTEHGGAGLGLVELCILLREVGRRTAAVPAFATLALGALPIARYGTPAQQAELLPGVADGSRVVTAALVEPFAVQPRSAVQPNPGVTATRVGDGWVLDGQRSQIWAGTVANTVLVPAATDVGTVLSVVPIDLPGVSAERQLTTTGVPEARLTFEAARLSFVDVLGELDNAAATYEGMVDIALVASAAVMAGVAAEAVRLTGEYTTERQQFGRPIASFQAVTQRAADAWVDTQSIELTMLQAAWRIDAGLAADREVAVAKFFAAEAGQRVVHSAQHLHGGMGVDRDYPLHRYFLLAKQHELFLGGASRQLLRLGAILAAEGPTRPLALQSIHTTTGGLK